MLRTRCGRAAGGAYLLSGRCAVVAAAPIITDGDVSGCVAFVSEKEDETADEVLLKLCQSAAQFLSKRIAV
mgnify:CR=1 FL=1